MSSVLVLLPMANVGLWPLEGDENPAGKFLTFIVPGTCNLRCSFCIVRQRDEMVESSSLPQDFEHFIVETSGREPICALGIQGFEPLMHGSLPYTFSVLRMGQRLKLPTSMVTNGTLLPQSASRLAALKPTKIGISVDSPIPQIHDRLRGVDGAWAGAIAGIESALKTLSADTRIAVTSVLMPGDRGQLLNMPMLLSKLGIRYWHVTPLQRIGRIKTGGPVDNREALFQALLRIQASANDLGVQLTIDDELECLQFGEAALQNPELRVLNVKSLPRGVELVRITPSGHKSSGLDILKRVHLIPRL